MEYMVRGIYDISYTVSGSNLQWCTGMYLGRDGSHKGVFLIFAHGRLRDSFTNVSKDMLCKKHAVKDMITNAVESRKATFLIEGINYIEETELSKQLNIISDSLYEKVVDYADSCIRGFQLEVII